MKRVITMLGLAAFLATTVPYVSATDSSHKSTMVAKKHKKSTAGKSNQGSTYNASKKSTGSASSASKSNASSTKK